MSEKITDDELKAITDAAVKRNNAKAVAERALLEAQNAELKHQVTVQHVFMKYGLTFNDKIDDNTGAITRGNVASGATTVEAAEADKPDVQGEEASE